MNKNPRMYLEKNPENNKKNPRHTKRLKIVKTELKCMLPVLAHKKIKYVLFASYF